MCHSMEILEMLEANKKLLLGPVVKYFRKKCCGKEGHCTNLLEGGYRKNMLMDIGNVVEEMKALCIEQRVKNYRVVNPNDMIGLSSQMEEEEVERLVGSSPIHLSGEGYAALAEAVISMVESKRAVSEGQTYEVLYSRNMECVYNTVAGTRKWRKPRTFNNKAGNRSGVKQDGYKSKNQYGGY